MAISRQLICRDFFNMNRAMRTWPYWSKFVGGIWLKSLVLFVILVFEKNGGSGMDKPRVLLTDEDSFIANNLAGYLQKNFDVIVCTESQQLLKRICEFEPDVLLLDLCLPGSDAFELISTIRASGNTMEIVATSRFSADYAAQALERFGVFHLIMKPFRNEFVTTCIYAAVQKRCQWDVELELYSILGSLSFQLGTNRARCVAEGILLWHRSNGNIATKQLYLELAHLYDKSATSFEKAIRDAIHHAWNRGNRNLWAAYFPEQNTLRQRCPSNEVFIARMAQCLWTKERIRLPYKKAE